MDSSIRNAELFGRTARTYESVGPPFFTHFAEEVVQQAAVRRGSRVLDLATGTGAVLLAAAKRAGPEGRMVGVDLSAEMLDCTRDRLRQQGITNAVLVRMDAESLGFLDAAFDFVFCNFALEILAGRIACLAGFRRVLRPEGLLGVVDAPGWFFQRDPRWIWMESLLLSFGALRESELSPAPLSGLADDLKTAGFQDVVFHEVTFPLRFASADEFWAWVWSHGSRRLLERIPQARLKELRHRLAAGLETCREVDRRIHGDLAAGLAVGRR